MKTIPGPFSPRTPERLAEIVKRMRVANQSIYQTLFRMHFGADCHAFLEFCGLMSKYADLCSRAAKNGIDFGRANIHTGTPLPMEKHDVLYLAEKFECIFGSFFRANPELARLFAKKALSL